MGQVRARPQLSVEELLAEMDAADVDRATLIPPEWDRLGNELVLDGAAAHPDRLAAFPSVSLRAPDGPRLLEEWAQRPGFLGLRQVFLAGPGYCPLTDGTAEWLWRAADALGLTMMVWLPEQLSAFGAIVDRFPGIRLIVDHLNMAMETDPPTVEAVLTELLVLADRAQVSVKASALPAMAAEPYPFRSAGERPSGACWTPSAATACSGSDFTRLPCSYRQAVTMVDHLGVDRASLLGGAFARWVSWPTLSGPRRDTSRSGLTRNPLTRNPLTRTSGTRSERTAPDGRQESNLRARWEYRLHRRSTVRSAAMQ